MSFYNPEANCLEEEVQKINYPVLHPITPLEYSQVSGTLVIKDASDVQKGVLTTTTQNIAGNKEFKGIITASNVNQGTSEFDLITKKVLDSRLLYGITWIPPVVKRYDFTIDPVGMSNGDRYISTTNFGTAPNDFHAGYIYVYESSSHTWIEKIPSDGSCCVVLEENKQYLCDVEQNYLWIQIGNGQMSDLSLYDGITKVYKVSKDGTKMMFSSQNNAIGENHFSQDVFIDSTTDNSEGSSGSLVTMGSIYADKNCIIKNALETKYLTVNGSDQVSTISKDPDFSSATDSELRTGKAIKDYVLGFINGLTDLGGASASDEYVPTQLAVKTYADTKLSSSSISTDGTLAANLDTVISSQKAVKTYTDNKISRTNNTLVFGTTQSSVPAYTYLRGTTTSGNGGYACAYSPSLNKWFGAETNSNNIYISSDDCVTWTKQAMTLSPSVSMSIVLMNSDKVNNCLWCGGIPGQGEGIWKSTNGISWTRMYNRNDYIYGLYSAPNGIVMALFAGSSPKFVWSTDVGATWNSTTQLDISWGVPFEPIMWNGYYYAVNDKIFRSSDLTNWTQVYDFPSNAEGRKFICGTENLNKLFVIGNEYCYFSTDGTTWNTTNRNAVNLQITAGGITQAIYIPSVNKFIAWSYGSSTTAGNYVAFSDDGLTWTLDNTSPHDSPHLLGDYNNTSKRWCFACTSTTQPFCYYSFDTNVYGSLTLNINTDTKTFTVDGTLASNSDANVPSEKAIKTYTDTSIANKTSFNNISVVGTTESTSTATGSLVVAGGVGIAKSLFVGNSLGVSGITTVTNTTESTSSTTGSLIVAGGIGVSKNLNVGGTINGKTFITDALFTAGLDTNIMSEKAVKTAIENKIRNKSLTQTYSNTTITTPNTTGAWMNIAYSPTLNVTLIGVGTLTEYKYVYSNDGVTYQYLSTGINAPFVDFMWIPELSCFFASTYTNSANAQAGFYKSTDGLTWTPSNVNLLLNLWRPQCYNSITNTIVCLGMFNGNSNGILYYSNNGGTSWSSVTRFVSAYNTLMSVSYGNGIYVICGDGLFQTSPDLINWSSNRNLGFACDSAYSNKLNRWVMVSTNSAYYSNDNWATYTQTSLVIGSEYQMIWNDQYNCFIGTGSSGKWAYSYDGITWTTITDATNTTFLGLTYNSTIDRFLSVSSALSTTRISSLVINYNSTVNNLTVEYDATNTASFSVSSTGDLTVDCSGNDFNFANTDVIHVLNTTESTSTSTGSLLLSGGLGIAKSLFVDGTINLKKIDYFSIAAGTYIKICTLTNYSDVTGNLELVSEQGASTILSYSSGFFSTFSKLTPFTQPRFIVTTEKALYCYCQSEKSYLKFTNFNNSLTLLLTASGAPSNVYYDTNAQTPTTEVYALSVINTTDTTGAGDGSIITNGGAYIAKKLYIADTTTGSPSGGSLITLGGLYSTKTVYIADQTEAGTSGALMVAGGISAIKNVQTLGTLIAKNTTSNQLSLRYNDTYKYEVTVNNAGVASCAAAGIVNTCPTTILSVAAIQQSIRYDATNKVDFSVSSAGKLNLDVYGKEITLTNPVWDDLQLLQTIKTTTAVYVDLVTIGGLAVQVLSFKGDNSNNYLEFYTQLPHTWALNTSFTPHIHWAPATNMTTTKAYMQLIFEIRDINDTFAGGNAGASVYNQFLEIGPQTVPKKHTMSSFPSFTPTLTGASAIIVGRLYRQSSNALDTYATNVNNYIHLLSFDLHIQKNKVLGDVGPY